MSVFTFVSYQHFWFTFLSILVICQKYNYESGHLESLMIFLWDKMSIYEKKL